MIRFVYCAAAVSMCAALAQTPTKSTAEMATHDEPALFKARVNLVMVPVVVRDRKGNAVGNLKQEDFQLFDKGKPQYIARFSMERALSRIYKAGGAVQATSPDKLVDEKPAELPDRFIAYLFDDADDSGCRTSDEAHRSDVGAGVGNCDQQAFFDEFANRARKAGDNT